MLVSSCKPDAERWGVYACRTDDQFAAFVKPLFFPRISDSDLAALLEYYPSDITQGSPFDTGDENALSPQYKRLAALLGDLIFQAPRRLLFEYTASKQNIWMYRMSIPFTSTGLQILTSAL